MVIPSFLFFVFSYLAAGTTGYLRYGDAISLAQVADKGVLYSLGVANDASGKAVIGGWKSDTISRLSQSPNTMLYIQPAQEATRWGSSNVTVKYGDLVRLEFASLAATTPSWLGYDFSSSADTAPAQIIRQTTNFSQNPNLGITFKIVRAKNFDATNDGTANSIVATGDQIALWGLVTPGGATPAKQMVLNFQTSTTTPDTGTFFCSAYPSTAAVNNYIFSIPSQHIQAQVLNFSNANTLPANVLAPAQKVTGWKETTPIAVPPPPPPQPPLCYGDAIVLKHNTYGFYLAMSLANGSDNTYWRWLMYGLSSPPADVTRTQFFVEPATSTARFDLVGTTVKSGDRIRLESVYAQGRGIANKPGGSVLSFAADDWYYMKAPVSSPCPPYYVALAHENAYAHQQPSYKITFCYCIYKPGANIGDLIYPKDTIYLVSWYYINNVGIPVYYGSTNQTINNDSTSLSTYSFRNQQTSTSQEVFIYQGSAANSVPNNFSHDYYWQIDNVISKAYLSALSGVVSPYDNGNGPYGQTQNFNGWPTASTFQWAVGYPS